MLQQFIVVLVVALAAGYALWSFVPIRTRARLFGALARRGWCTAIAARYQARLLEAGCGNCAARPRASRH